MKHLYGVLALALLASCGNPHLTRMGNNVKNSFPLVSDDQKSVGITNTDGAGSVGIITELPSATGLVTLKNPNDEEILTEYAFEKGDHFRFNGDSFPGTGGNCAAAQLANSNCLLDIEFHADEPGVFTDNLIITQSLKSDPSKKKIVTVPLRGERIRDNLIPIQLIPTTLGEQLELKTDKPSIDSQLSVRNPNTDEVVVTYAFENGEHFRFNGGSFPGTNGNCAASQLPNSGCELDIEFHADEVGIYTDTLVATYSFKSNPDKKKKVLIPLKGERTAVITSSLTVKPVGDRTSIDYGTDVVGSPTIRQDRVVVTNDGQRDQAIDIKIEGGRPFTLTENCPEVLRAGTSCEVIVTYSSPTPGSHQDRVVITHHSSTDASPIVIKVPVTGVTTAASVPLTPGKLVFIGLDGADIDMGAVFVGSDSRKLVEVRNVGEQPVTLSSKVISGTSFLFNGGSYPGSRGTCGQIILPGTCMLEVEFRPALMGSHTGSLVLVTSAGETLNIGIKGSARRRQEQVCRRVEEQVVVARPSTVTGDVVFPYLSSAPDTVARLGYLYGLATNSYIRATNMYAVKDAQVYTTFDVPAIEDDILDILIEVNVSKVIQDEHKDTESFCLSHRNVKKCSGRQFTLASWNKLQNPAFWSTFRTPVTSTYEDDFSRTESNCGAYKCFSLVKTYSASELFDLSAAELNSLRSGKLSVIFSDDTRMRAMPRIKIRTNKSVSCH